ncbi:MAG: hypothetical protein ACRCU2_14355 [Planktothrix sp.]
MLAEMAIASFGIIGGLPSQVLMTGRSICRIAIFGTICFGASIFLPELTLPIAFLSTDEGQEFLTKAAGMISSVTAGNIANAIDNFDPSRSDYVRLENEDLIRVCGKAIAQIILLASQNSKYDGPTRKRLKIIAAKATEAWVKLACREFGRSNYQELTEGEIPLIITPTEAGLTQSEILKFEEWYDIFVSLDIEIDPNQGVDLEVDVRRDVAKLLQKEFPKVLREALKQDFKQDGKAFAGLMIQLMTGIRQQLAQQGEIAIIFLNKLSNLEQQLTGTEQQIQQVFIDISAKMQTGFEQLCRELCHKFDIKFDMVETNINTNLQKLTESLNDIKEDTAVIRTDTTFIKEEFIKLRQYWENPPSHPPQSPRKRKEDEVREALLYLDYREQLRLFENFLDADRIVGAFLIHGSNKCETQWLVTSLINNVLNIKIETSNTSNGIIRLSFEGNTQTRGLSSIMTPIIDKFELTIPSDSVNDIVKAICKRWKSQTIILVIEVNQNIDPSLFQEFIKDFWEPLAKSANEMRQKKYEKYNYSLMLFLADIDGCTKNWEISFAEDIASPQIPEIPLKFMEITPIPRGQIMQWIRTNIHIFKGEILDFRDDLFEEISGLSAGQESICQQDVFEKICDFFEVDIKWM